MKTVTKRETPMGPNSQTIAVGMTPEALTQAMIDLSTEVTEMMTEMQEMLSRTRTTEAQMKAMRTKAMRTKLMILMGTMESQRIVMAKLRTTLETQHPEVMKTLMVNPRATMRLIRNLEQTMTERRRNLTALIMTATMPAKVKTKKK